jgi:hypothetical protein
MLSSSIIIFEKAGFQNHNSRGEFNIPALYVVFFGNLNLRAHCFDVKSDAERTPAVSQKSLLKLEIKRIYNDYASPVSKIQNHYPKQNIILQELNSVPCSD